MYSGSIQAMQDPWGRQIYWIGGGSIEWSGEETSDFRAIQEGYISVTPLHLDLTHHDSIPRLRFLEETLGHVAKRG